jgi:hypothetical protein
MNSQFCESNLKYRLYDSPSWTGTTSNGHLDVATGNPPATDNSQTNHHSSEWVELFVKEMMSSSDIDDARARASRALDVFEKSIMDRVGAEAVQSLHRVLQHVSHAILILGFVLLGKLK